MQPVLLWLWNLGKPSSPLPVLMLGAAVMFSGQLHREIHDVDIFWQVKLGEITLKHGLPPHEPFLANKDHEPLAAVAWLGQVLYAIVKLIGGWPLLRLVDAAVWFGGFVLVARQCAKQSGNDWPALAGLFVGWYAAIPHASLRPQSLALLCFSLLMVLVRSPRGSRSKLLLGTFLLVAWQNLHPSVILGIGYLASALFAAVVRSSKDRWLLLALLLVAGFATVLTPAGSGIFAISKYNEEISKERGITEWLPMWWEPMAYGRDHAWIGFALAFQALGLALLTRITIGTWRVKLLDVLALLGLTAASLLMHRFAIFWAVAAIPVVAGALAFPSAPATFNRLRIPLVLLAMLLAVLPPMIEEPAPFADYYPFEATQALKDSGFEGTIYCNYFWGGVLAEAGHPNWKMSHDGRYYLFTRDEWSRYNRASEGLVPLDRLLAQFHPKAFVLRKNRGSDWPNDDGLIRLLRPNLRVLHEDKQAVIFVVD